MTMRIRFWGVRGSVPSPGPDTAEVGGNTSCVEVVLGNGRDEQRIVLDAGTGLRGLGQALARKGPVEATVLLSHVHWDHIQGVPFFGPLYSESTRLRFVAGAFGGSLEGALHAQMRTPHFPVDLSHVPSQLQFETHRDGARIEVGESVVTLRKANHPDAVYAYRIDYAGRSIVYATDTEHYACLDPRLVALARGADVLVYDAQYLPEEYDGRMGFSRVGWGHSTWTAGCELARAADVGQLVLFHHDPTRSDADVCAIETLARHSFQETIAAREGLEIALGAAISSAA
jgi:phosphoribosyl 1,2-cyclic phosphodiesterase